VNFSLPVFLCQLFSIFIPLNELIMKTFGTIIALFLFPVLLMAQGKLKPMDEGITPPKSETDYRDPNETNSYKQQTAPVQQSTGKVYGEQELLRMSRRNVNSVAGTVAGVDSRPGTNEVPHIRGAASSGTAYYVDGVRIYGALPILTK
jgi:hypothetical protein